MEAVSYQSKPQLRRPVLIGAFAGWNDAAESATIAVEHLRKQWNARRFASIDPEEFFDFQVTRPRVVLDDDTRRIEWPQTTFAHAEIPGTDRDAVLLVGSEPSMRWRTFSRAVLEIAHTTDVELVVTLGALLANRPHSRPVRVSGASADSDLAKRLGLGPSRYEGPTGIVGVLHDACRKAQLPAVSLWAWVPHYLREAPSPKAALELVRRLAVLLDFRARTGELEDDAREYEEQISEAVEADPEFATQVRELEKLSDEEEMEDLPSGDEIAAHLERFLKDQRPPGE